MWLKYSPKQEETFYKNTNNLPDIFFNIFVLLKFVVDLLFAIQTFEMVLSHPLLKKVLIYSSVCSIEMQLLHFICHKKKRLG